MNNNGWENYSIHVLKSLERIREEIKDLHKKLDDHVEVDNQHFVEVKQELAKIHTETKWHTRTFGAVFGVLGSLVTKVFGVLWS